MKQGARSTTKKTYKIGQTETLQCCRKLTLPIIVTDNRPRKSNISRGPGSCRRRGFSEASWTDQAGALLRRLGNGLDANTSL